MIGWCIESLREIHREALDVGEFAEASKAVQQIYKIARDMGLDMIPEDE